MIAYKMAVKLRSFLPKIASFTEDNIFHF